jgi:hypothetical protein
MLMLAIAASASGQSVPASDPVPSAGPADSATVVPGPEYRAGPLIRFLVGSGYRNLWTEPIRVPVLDLEHFAGGLTPLKTGQHGGQTWSLHVQGGDGEEYVLRSVDKHVKLGPEVASGVPAWLLRDQISAGLATGALIVAPLLRAAQVPHEDPLLRVIPDDPRLGEYRKQFAGLLVWVEHRPRDDDTSKIAKTPKMLKEISTKVTERLDSRGYLTARLMDLYVGDWDRGPLQWFWERTGDKHGHLWRAIPHDRDWAFANHEGFLYWNIRPTIPWFVTYRPQYPNLIGLEANVWGQDRRLLQDLECPVWDSTATWLKSALTDSVIDDAVAQLPGPERARYGHQLVVALRARRDALPWAAHSFCRTVAGQADVHTVAVLSIVEITRRRDTLEIRVGTRGDQSVTYYDRRFDAASTHEVRLFLDGGKDSVVVSGGGDHILLRLIAGADGDVLVDSRQPGAGGTNVYDAEHRVRVLTGDVSTDHAIYTPPKLPAGTPEADRVPVSFLLRDAGSWCEPASVFAASSAAGVMVQTGLQCDEFGFRRIPWAVENTVTAGYAIGPGGVAGAYTGAVRGIGGSPIWSLHVEGTSAEYVWFYGLGNESGRPLPDEDYRARQARISVAPGISFEAAPQLTLTLAPELRYRDVEQSAPQYFSLVRPYGSGSFGVVDGAVSAVFDTRHESYSDSSGMRLEVSGRGVPAWWNAASPYGRAHAEAAAFTNIPHVPLDPIIDLRIGGDKVWGRAPFQDLATVGGLTTVSAYLPGRFSGQAAAYGQAKLFLTLAQTTLVAPASVGIVGLNDVGRVFVSGEQSTLWHDGYGGGVWSSFLDQRYLISATLSHGTEGTVFIAGFGLGW